MNYSSLAHTSMQWHKMMQSTRMNFFLIPATVFTTVTLLIDPLLLFCILCNPSLRQETRYLLLANTLLSDALFLVLNLANLSSNAANLEMHYAVCEVITVTTMTTYCSSVLTVTLMVIDTFLAVRWPLRYNQILPPSRAIKLIGFVWAVAALYPLVSPYSLPGLRGNRRGVGRISTPPLGHLAKVQRALKQIGRAHV